MANLFGLNLVAATVKDGCLLLLIQEDATQLAFKAEIREFKVNHHYRPPVRDMMGNIHHGPLQGISGSMSLDIHDFNMREAPAEWQEASAPAALPAPQLQIEEKK